MSHRFIQLHLLTFYGPANLNRDDTGRPKTAIVGGVERLRVSSQSLKRAVRTSEVFKETLSGHYASRTQRLGKEIEDHLKERQIPDDQARSVARDIAGMFGKIKGEKENNPTYIEQLAFISPEERAAAIALAERKAADPDLEIKKDDLLQTTDGAADIAMFGRMLADDPKFNREAAVQVSHAFTTHKGIVEADFYTANDDVKAADENADAGAGFLGNTGFGSGVFYTYANVNVPLLLENLGGNAEIAQKSIAALTQCLATVSPTGKQNSFASRSRADYILAERGNDAPRNLAGAFLEPVTGENLMSASARALEDYRKRMTKAYGETADDPAVLDVHNGAGSLSDIVTYVTA
ncbi:MAG: type I-E CRISPR-associated protein Cas7/Cse4/CasC [Hyphomicrobiaceae bacterium]